MTTLLGILTLTGIAIGRIPYLRMNRATIALVGAVLIIISSGNLNLEQAFNALDIDTLVLLFSMMIISINMRLSGFFRVIAAIGERQTNIPHLLLASIMLFAATLSAIFLNDTIAIMFTPIVIEITRQTRRDPIPYLIGLATSANIGSLSTILGNPQNMLIGTSSGIQFFTFTSHLILPVILSLIVAWLLVVISFPVEFRKAPGRSLHHDDKGITDNECTSDTTSKKSSIDSLHELEGQILKYQRTRPLYRPLFLKCLLAIMILIMCLSLHVSIALSALLAASVLLVTRRLHPDRVFREIDWSLLVLFSGLFIIMDGLTRTSLFQLVMSFFSNIAYSSDALFGISAAILSNIVSNVPAVMMLRPLIPTLPDPQHAWLFLAMATTFAGNLTIIGSVANLIVIESARKAHITISFWTYLKVGAPITFASLIIGFVCL